MVFKKVLDNVNKDYSDPKGENKQEEVKTDKPKIKDKDIVSDDKVKGNDNEQYDYLVELNDIWGTSSKRIDPFGVKRAIIGGNVWLINEKLNFKEPMPEDTDDYKSYKLDELTKEIGRIENKLKDIKNKRSKETTRDLIQDVKQLKNWKRSIELQGRGSYMNLSSKRDAGMPYFMFDRKGNFKLPVFKNVDYSLMYVPNEAKISEASDLIKENDDKNGVGLGQIKLINYILTAMLVILVGVMFYFIYKTNSTQTMFVSGGLQNMTDAITGIVLQNQETIEVLKEVVNQTTTQTIDNSIKITPENLN